MRLLHITFCVFVLLLAHPLWAQRDSSLTREFERMSARDRARVAREEEEAAQQDAVFLGHMRQGEEHFQAGRYNDALVSYRTARSLRPLNVHPKVKIQDLEALIARKAEETTEASPSLPAPVEPRPNTDTSPAPPPAPVVVAPAPPPQPVATTAPEPVQKPPVVRPSVRPSTATQPDAVEGVRTFREGRAVVEERVVREGERLVVWRKVVHPWGEVVHFRDNEAVPARRWQERFSDQ